MVSGARLASVDLAIFSCAIIICEPRYNFPIEPHMFDLVWASNGSLTGVIIDSLTQTAFQTISNMWVNSENKDSQEKIFGVLLKMSRIYFSVCLCLIWSRGVTLARLNKYIQKQILAPCRASLPTLVLMQPYKGSLSIPLYIIPVDIIALLLEIIF